MTKPMTGYDASSAERYTGMLDLQVKLSPACAAGECLQVAQHLETFSRAIGAGLFLPGSMSDTSRTASVETGLASVRMRLEVVELPTTALAVLGGMLRHAAREGVVVESACAVLTSGSRDLLADTGVRPSAVSHAPFAVEFPADLSGNYTLLVEVVFADPIEAQSRDRLLQDLALWDWLTLAYPIDASEGVRIVEAQSHFHDPRTIHHHEWIWENVDPLAWNLLVNLCCVWGQERPVVRLHVE